MGALAVDGRACRAKFAQNREATDALLSTGDRPLTHVVRRDSRTIPAGQEAFFSCGSGLGGPVVVSSNQPVLASQRVQYYQSFNEVPGQL